MKEDRQRLIEDQLEMAPDQRQVIFIPAHRVREDEKRQRNQACGGRKTVLIKFATRGLRRSRNSVPYDLFNILDIKLILNLID